MRLLLINPPVQDFYDTRIRLFPLGLAYLKASINKYLPEIEVLIRDYHSPYGKKTISLPAPLKFVHDFYPVKDSGPFCGFYEYYHFGLDFDAIIKDIQSLKPDLIGISSLFTAYAQEVFQLCKLIKKHYPVPILLGGGHVSALPELCLNNPDTDFIIRGEGERAMVEFLKEYTEEQNYSKVPNLGYKINSSIVLNPISDNYEIDSLAYPEVKDFLHDGKTGRIGEICMIMTSRSCPYRCTFCSVHQVFGKKYRMRSVDNIIEEMQLRYRQGFKIFDFEDDNLTFDRNRFQKLCQSIMENLPRDIELKAMNGICYDNLDNEILALMKKSGFRELNLAYVSRNSLVYSSVNRGIKHERFKDVVLAAKELGFKLTCYQIIGLPMEELDSMVETLAFLARLPVLIGASPFYVIPGTEISSTMCMKDIYRNELDYMKARLTVMGQNTAHVSREDIYTLFITTRIINFLKDRNHFDKKRQEAGLMLLEKLLTEKKLYHLGPKGALVQSQKFKYEVFEKFWSIYVTNGTP